MIKAIIFDWGGVLIDNPAEEMMKYCAKELNVDLWLMKNVGSKYENDFQKGLIEENIMWKKICDEMKVKTPETKSLWKEGVGKVFTDRKEIFELAKTLRKKGYKIGFLSNTEIPSMEYFIDNGYEKYFDATVFSCHEKTIKPEEKIYRIALEKLGTKPEQTIFIDDKIQYVDGAKRVGIKGILYLNKAQLIERLKGFSVKVD